MDNIEQLLNDYFGKNKIEIIQFPEKSTRTFKTYTDFYNFILKEKVFWSKCNNGILSQTRAHFIDIDQKLSQALKMDDFNQALSQVNTAIQNTSITFA